MFPCDCLQLVGEGVCVFDHFNEVGWDAGAVSEKFGVPVSRYIDYLSLVGDTSNNIKGVQGVGPKTAVKLLSDYPDLEAILGDEEAGTAAQKVIAAAREARQARQLVTLKTDVELGLNLRSLRYTANPS